MVDEPSMVTIIARVQSELHNIDLFRENTVRFLRHTQTSPNHHRLFILSKVG